MSKINNLPIIQDNIESKVRKLIAERVFNVNLNPAMFKMPWLGFGPKKVSDLALSNITIHFRDFSSFVISIDTTIGLAPFLDRPFLAITKESFASFHSPEENLFILEGRLYVCIETKQPSIEKCMAMPLNLDKSTEILDGVLPDNSAYIIKDIIKLKGFIATDMDLIKNEKIHLIHESIIDLIDSLLFCNEIKSNRCIHTISLILNEATNCNLIRKRWDAIKKRIF